MELELTKRNLRRLAEQENPAVEDVLNFIYDFCHDIKTDTGIPVEKLRCGDEDALYKRLPWMGRQIMRIGKQKEDLFSEVSRQNRVREINTEIDSLSAELENADAALSSLLQEKNRKLEELHSQQEELRRKNEELRQQIDEQRKQTEELRQEYAELAGTREQELEEARRELEEREKKKGELQELLDGKTAELVRLDAGRTAGEVEELQRRSEMLQKLQEKLREEWSGTWGQEQAERLTDANMGELLKDNLREISLRLTRCGKSLREAAEALAGTDTVR